MLGAVPVPRLHNHPERPAVKRVISLSGIGVGLGVSAVRCAMRRRWIVLMNPDAADGYLMRRAPV